MTQTNLNGLCRSLFLVAGFALAAGAVSAQGPTSPTVPLTAIASEDGTTIRLQGADRDLQIALCDGTAVADIRPAGRPSGLGVAIDRDQDGCRPASPLAELDDLTVVPQFPLLESAAHDLVLAYGDSAQRVISVERTFSLGPAPRVMAVWPDAEIVPANILRFYLKFDQPMARGSVAEHVHLETADGEVLTDVFLNLGVELWSPDQTRVTLMLDPGRIKRGVGPNTALGAPLDVGETYKLVVDRAMRDAQGRPLTVDYSHTFLAASAERRAVDPANWRIETPAIETREPVRVSFDRVVDRPNVLRYLAVVGSEGSRVEGHAEMIDQTWMFSPVDAWPSDPVALHVSARTEDAAGNTLCFAFDVEAETGSRCEENIALELNLSPSP
ncbi:hypothetical protein [Roseobacter weihaiensis]|uniref:hypothetical protein n=1 Tax=Roseobacter weihaiensis TaxID=2763262 RepID=UPI001D09B2E1|nr:hypothetical protein [Roseobacter sp. H9]